MPDRRHASRTHCQVADVDWMVSEHHRVRHEVFVREQHLFQGSDRDGHDDDPATIKVVATHDGMVGGAVRLYALDAAGRWQGDRLAVLATYRRHGLGAPLVRFAVATAGGLGGSVMTAHIQVSNVRFFEHLGWQVDGDEEIYVGVPHVPMAIDLRAPMTAGRRRDRPGAVSPDRAPAR
jgi:putative N-acetyltransferase (TIGR04045 family)